MKKLIYLLIASIVAMGVMVGCTKPDIKPEEQQKQEEHISKNSTLIITLYDNTTKTYLAGANAALYNVSDDALVAIVAANEKGIATFSNLDISKTYYFVIAGYDGQNYVCDEEITLEKGENRITFTVTTTTLTISVKNENGNVVSGATVRLFANSTDYAKQTNIVGSSKYTDSKGQVTFNGLDQNTTYYFYVKNDTQTNESGTYYKYCVKGANSVSTIIKEESKGIIRLNNNATGSDGGTYKFTIRNTTTGFNKTYTVSQGYYQDIKDMPAGSYTVYMEQQDGYLFSATTGTMTGTLFKDKTLTFSTANL
ncbi:MAG: hypothetical protein MJ197_06535 [Bacteroidales bacterium]|nr:hypothetical protein [Bacteroidales bacterium]